MTEANVSDQQLLAVLAGQGNTGDVLLSEPPFVDALVKVQQQLTGAEASESRRSEFAWLVQETNTQDPSILLVPGVENWIAKSVLAQARKANWGITEIQERGNQAVRDFVRGAQATALMAQLGVDVKQLNQRNCLRSIVNAISGKQDSSHRNAEARLAQLKASTPEVPPAARVGDDHEHHQQVLTGLLEDPVGEPSEQEAEERQQAQKTERGDLRKTQMGELVATIDNYVKLGRISEEDAEKLRKAHRVDEAMRDGKVDREKGRKIRNSALAGTARDRIERSLKEALDYAVVYLQVFRSLGQIEERFDPALKFLTRNGPIVNANAGDEEVAQLGEMVLALFEDVDTLRLLIDLMDRKDADVRMIGACLSPYSHIAAQLHSGDKRARARPAAAMITMTVLLGRLIKPTPIRKEIRLLKVNLIIEEFYCSTDDIDHARAQAEEFLRTRLKSLYPDLSREESEAMQEQGEKMLAAVEQKVVAERAAQGVTVKTTDMADGDGDGEDLSAEKKSMGVEIHRIPIRVAGRVRQVPQKIMPDPDDAERHVIAQRDPDTGELVPARRRGGKRYVIKAREGWALEKE
ncbi:MAG: hypothetical protein QF768_10580 [Candidatus Latescibacteria bacterium]|nr:hypothetical protein [Candidatus Latescibacterota bacterium]